MADSSSSSTSSISSLSAFEIENVKSSTILTSKKKPKHKPPPQQNSKKLSFNETNTQIPYISINNSIKDDKFSKDLYPFLSTASSPYESKDDDTMSISSEFLRGIDKSKEKDDESIKSEESEPEDKVEPEDGEEKVEIEVKEQIEIEVKEEQVEIKKPETNVEIKDNIQIPKPEKEKVEKYSPKPPHENLKTEKSNASSVGSRNPTHSPKDPSKDPKPFSPPIYYNNTDYIQKILKPDEYQKSPDDREKSTQKLTTPKKSVYSNPPSNSYKQQIKPSPIFSNASKHSVYSNISKKSSQSAASRHSILSKNTEVSLSESTIFNNKERGTYIAKYYILKDMYPNMNIKIPSDDVPIDTLKEEYNELYKKVCADRFASEYRTYIAIAFAVIEVILCKVFKMNAVGFTKFHLKRINQYNESLLLLGENSAQEATVRNPISEIITAGAVNTIFFVLIKYIGKYVNEDTAENVVQGILDSINKNTNNNIDIHGLSPDSIGDYVSTFMNFIPDKENKPKKSQMKRPTYRDDD